MPASHDHGPRPMAEALSEAAPLTRQQRRLLDTLVDMGRAVTVVELANEVDSHPNTVREHLAVLEEHGLVTATSMPSQGRGRPRKEYRATSGSQGAPARHLVGLINAALRSFPDETARSDGYRWGQTWGDDIVESGLLNTREGAVEAVTSLMADMGFAPRASLRSPSCLQLTQCPLLTEGQEIPKGLCDIHQGMLDQVLKKEKVGASAFVEPFAEPNACRLTVAEHQRR
ncbi:MAG: helix-turn-helix domain-containing protein [Flaviflexus sp.]|uniref:helix-turn-helix transcriptional regulator n=1 Tax=Flaviflexus sp. TaxID=1969482 RepID=UPI00352F498A